MFDEKWIFAREFLWVEIFAKLLVSLLKKRWRNVPRISGISTTSVTSKATLKYNDMSHRLSRWPRGLRSVCESSCLKGLRVRNPAEGMYVCVSVLSAVCCQVEVCASGWSLFQRSPTACSVTVWVWLWILDSEETLALRGKEKMTVTQCKRSVKLLPAGVNENVKNTIINLFLSL